MRLKQKHAHIILTAVFTVVGLFVMASLTLAHDSPWVKKADMPIGRHSFAASVVDDKIYAFGGRYTDNLVTEYDPATDTWTTKIPMPTPRMLPASGVANGKIYVIGGIVAAFNPALSTVEEYDPATDAWTTKKPMPTKRLGLGVSVVDGKIYAIGGMTSGSVFWSGMHSTVEVYDPLTDTWSTKTDMPTARVWFSTSMVDGKIYAIGGALVTKKPLSTVEVYDPATDTWTTKTPMPTARMAHAAAVVDGIIYVIGGGTENGQPVGGYSVVEAYDPATDTWTRKADIPEPRASFSASVVGGKIYAIGGIPTFADPHLYGLGTVYEYNPSRDLTALINQVNINKCFAVAGSDSVCITTKLNNPTGVTLLAEIESPDNTPVDSLELFDDGNHNDGKAADSLYANIWPVSSAEECQYYMDLKVTQVNTETIIHRMDNMALFTTIGPVVIENFTFTFTDTVPNPGDELRIKLTFKNEGSTATAANIKARLISLDTLAMVITDTYIPYSNIKSGESKTGSSYYSIKISEDSPDNAEIQFAVEITSNDFHFWSDTFSIPVVPQATMINTRENIPQQFCLYQNYPNPFNPNTMINYQLSMTSAVELSIYNLLGQKVATLVNERKSAGYHQVEWDASNMASGVYMYRLEAEGHVETRKMLLMR